MNKPLAWSYSSLTAFETCPWRWYLTKISKQVVESQHPATIDGNKKHKALELHLKGEAYLPSEYRQWVPLVERIKATPGKLAVERKVALTNDFRETTYFGKDVWVRMGFDVEVVQQDRAVLLDWKAGKRKVDMDQLKLFAAAAFKLHPHIETVDTAYIWLKDNKMDPQSFHRDEGPGIWQEFISRVRRIEIAIERDNFPKSPSGLCRAHCPVGHKLCEHCGT